MTNKEMVSKLPIEFKQFADNEGISLLYIEDWMPWYECWCAGYAAAKSEQRTKRKV